MTSLKGSLYQYANPELWEMEETAWADAAAEKYDLRKYMNRGEQMFPYSDPAEYVRELRESDRTEQDWEADEGQENEEF